MPKLLTVFVFLGLSACQPILQNDEVKGRIMGTTYTIKTQHFEIDKQQIDKRLNQINQIFSSWDQSSELFALNRQPIGESLSVSNEMAFVLKESMRVHEQTNGFFSPTMGNLIDAWGFGSVNVEQKPNQMMIKQALAQSSIERLTLNGSRFEKSADIKINLSAIAKGYAVDEIAKILKDKSVKRFMVEVGGEIKTQGSWLIGIETPSGQASVAVELVDESIATSGNYRQFFVWQGGRYAHILDPHTGLPVSSDLFSASVIHKSNMLADAYATAMMAMGHAKAVKMAQELNLKAILVLNKCDDPCLSKNIIKIGL